MEDKKDNLGVRIVVLAVLMGLFIWSYNQFTINYRNIEMSHRMVEALLRNKTELAEHYAKELGLTQKNLQRTEEFLSKVQEENDKLREQVKLLDKMAELEETVARLKEKNALIINQMASMRGPMPEAPPKPKAEDEAISTTAQGKAAITELLEKIGVMKDKIRGIKRDEHQQKMSIQKEVDRIESMKGNSGFIIKDGEVISLGTPSPADKQQPKFKVDVEFIK